MLYSEFKALVSRTLNEGDKYDPEIPDFIRAAGLWIERNKTYKYMERFVGFTLSTIADEPRVLPILDDMKAISFIRLIVGGKEYAYLEEKSPKEVPFPATGLPSVYWIDGAQHIWLDKTPDQNYSGEMSYDQYTNWIPLEETDGTSFLLTFAFDLLLAQVIIEMSPIVRKPELAQLFKPIRDEKLATLENADYTMRFANRDFAKGRRTDPGLAVGSVRGNPIA